VFRVTSSRTNAIEKIEFLNVHRQLRWLIESGSFAAAVQRRLLDLPDGSVIN
jgi:hypothetical protein